MRPVPIAAALILTAASAVMSQQAQPQPAQSQPGQPQQAAPQPERLPDMQMIASSLGVACTY